MVNMMTYSDKLSEDHITIFLLHGVIEEQKHKVRNYTRKHITAKYFYQFLKDLNQCGTPLSMDDVIFYINNKKKLPNKPFAITFDDGFENNYSIARPILKEFNIPATFYVTTDFIESNRMSWIDRIEYVIELSDQGRFEIQDKFYSFTNEIESKKNLLNEIRKQLKSQKNIDLDSVATHIQNQLGFKQILSSDDPLDKKMNWQQVSELNNDSLCIIGGHTHTHPVLSNLSDEDSKKEIKTSLEIIHNKIGLQCHHYSYPEGLFNCYSEREIAILKDNKVVCCPSAEDGLNTIDSDLFHLKRVFVV